MNIVKEQTIVYPLADLVTQTSHDVYFGLFYQGGNSILGESSRENLARSAGALEFNTLFWGNTYLRIKAEASISSTTAETGFGNLSQAQEYGIKPYNQLKKATKGTDLQSHHLIEKRFAKILKLEKEQMKAIAVTKPEHQTFTNVWRNLISYGEGTRTAIPEQIYNAAKMIYKDYSEILKAIGL